MTTASLIPPMKGGERVSKRKGRGFALAAPPLAEEDAGRNAANNLGLRYEAALKRMAERFGVTEGEISLFLWTKAVGGAMG
jgi:hypothetical protein